MGIDGSDEWDQCFVQYFDVQWCIHGTLKDTNSHLSLLADTFPHMNFHRMFCSNYCMVITTVWQMQIILTLVSASAVVLACNSKTVCGFLAGLTFIGPYNIVEAVIQMSLCPIQLFNFVPPLNQLAVCTSAECPAEFSTTAKNSFLRNLVSFRNEQSTKLKGCCFIVFPHLFFDDGPHLFTNLRRSSRSRRTCNRSSPLELLDELGYSSTRSIDCSLLLEQLANSWWMATLLIIMQNLPFDIPRVHHITLSYLQATVIQIHFFYGMLNRNNDLSLLNFTCLIRFFVYLANNS